MKIILSLLLILLSLNHSRAQEASPTISVKNYFCFLTDPTATPDAADQLYDSTMQDQIQRTEEGDQITYQIVDGQNNQPMLGLTDLEIELYSHWAEAAPSTSAPLMMFFPSYSPSGSKHSDSEHSDSEHESDEHQKQRSLTDNDPSSSQQRGILIGIREHHKTDTQQPPPSPSNLLLHTSGTISSDEGIQLSFIRTQSLGEGNRLPHEKTPLLDAQQHPPSYGQKMERTLSHQEEAIEQGYVNRIPSGSELACYAAMCAQPALLAYSGGIIHGATLAACAKGYLVTALAESGGIGASIAIPLVGFHLYDSLHAHMTPCAEAVTKHCLNFQNHLSAFLSSEEPPLTLFQRIEQDKQAAWTAQDNVKFEALTSLQTKLVLKANSQGQTSAELSDEEVMKTIQELTAQQETALPHFQQNNRSDLAAETKLKIAALKIYIAQEGSK